MLQRISQLPIPEFHGNPICANSENNNAIEDYELTLASSGLGAGTTLTKSALEAVARCTGKVITRAVVK